VAVTEASSGEFLKARLEAFERAQVRQALDDAGGNKSEAARRLGVGVRTLYKMLSRLGLA
jgi:two-component system response regulator HydG